MPRNLLAEMKVEEADKLGRRNLFAEMQVKEAKSAPEQIQPEKEGHFF